MIHPNRPAEEFECEAEAHVNDQPQNKGKTSIIYLQSDHMEGITKKACHECWVIAWAMAYAGLERSLGTGYKSGVRCRDLINIGHKQKRMYLMRHRAEDAEQRREMRRLERKYGRKN